MQIENLVRGRIQIGEFSGLRTFQSTCPVCKEDFNFLWPIEVLSVPLHRIVDLKCPHCDKQFTVIAIDLVVSENNRLRSSEVVRFL